MLIELLLLQIYSRGRCLRKPIKPYCCWRALHTWHLALLSCAPTSTLHKCLMLDVRTNVISDPALCLKILLDHEIGSIKPALQSPLLQRLSTPFNLVLKVSCYFFGLPERRKPKANRGKNVSNRMWAAVWKVTDSIFTGVDIHCSSGHISLSGTAAVKNIASTSRSIWNGTFQFLFPGF